MDQLDRLLDEGYRIVMEKSGSTFLMVVSRPGKTMTGPHGVKATLLTAHGSNRAETMEKVVGWLAGEEMAIFRTAA